MKAARAVKPEQLRGVGPKDPFLFLPGEEGQFHHPLDRAVEVVPGEVRAQHDAVGPDVLDQPGQLVSRRGFRRPGSLNDLVTVEGQAREGAGHLERLPPAATSEVGQDEP